ncbi:MULTISPECIES: Arc family DNA-binding protein [Pseudomonadaceae]|uniref:Arc family DNA-binding protein n=1 Tax=Aquipseudomonas guryensis TaxID=2759165 RepID=A0A7W4DDY6_9GAMM|nr:MULTISPECIES: Arc family DNA-binding protein [Pseudomonas]MBB1520745.1 Arc family DNA-binding protein [Pseudomonas guryensis]UUY06827.1 Arc family DNA-binding protein [Pseudomonas sp. J452]
MRPMKQAIYSSRTADKFVVRLPDGMRERIADVARNHHRSMNSEIIARLEQTLLQEGVLGDDQGLRLDSPELSLHERELLQRFRQLSHRQQNALVALIAHDAELAAEQA